MKLIFNSESYNENKNYIDHFEEIYTKGFPDKNEREDFNDIIKRVIGEKQPTEPHSIIVLSINEKLSEVYGGLIADWYENSKCIHLIYLIIDNNIRERGIAKSLINYGVILIKNWIEKTKGIEIKNVFFESNNPEKTINDNFDPITRLDIFSHLGAKWIDIPYVQPALDETKDDVNNLFLLSFTQFNAKGDKIPEVEITAFLKDFYVGLGKSVNNASFIEMQKDLEKTKNEEGDIILKHIPENTSFKFYRASVTWHFLQKNVKKNVEKNDSSTSKYFSSFEKDLLNFQNQKKTPFKSVFNGPQLKATLVFPEVYHYFSEGRKNTKTTKNNRVELLVNLSISYTEIQNSNEIIWHLSISPSGHQFFTEFDLIKLSTLFGSSQEDSTVKDEIKITISEKQLIKINPLDLIYRLWNIEDSTRLENLGVGIVQVETFKFDALKNFRIKEFFKIFQDKKDGIIEDDSIKQFSKALCGIILGIFDFNRMDNEEIFDTIQPIVQSDSSFIVLCRGSLLKISENDEIMESVSNNIIVSPYLLVPSMVLAFNEYLLSNAKIEIDNLLNQTPNIKLNKLELCQSEVMNILGFKYLGDIFHYSSEKEIIEYGNSQRGINHIYGNILNRLVDLSAFIAIKKEEKSNFSYAFINAFLSFIAMFQLNSLFAEWNIIKYHPSIFYLFAFFTSVTIFFLIRAKKKYMFSTKKKTKKKNI